MRLSKLTLVVLTFGIGIVCAKQGQALSIRGLVDAADLIIAGRVERVHQTGAGAIEFEGREYTRLDLQAEMRVDETIKGEAVPFRFTFSYSRPAVDRVMANVPDGGLAPNTYRVVFLKKTTTGYLFVSPYYPSLPAAPKSCGPNWQVELGEDAYHKVLQRVLNVLCTISSPEEKRVALLTLNWNQDSSAAPFLKFALNLPQIKSDPVLRISVLSALLEWKDLSALPLAEDELFRPAQQTPDYIKSNLILAMSSLNPRISVPLLSRA